MIGGVFGAMDGAIVHGSQGSKSDADHKRQATYLSVKIAKWPLWLAMYVLDALLKKVMKKKKKKKGIMYNLSLISIRRPTTWA